MIKNKQSGQTILVFLMILLVGFTIGLGIYLNSLTELGVTVKEKESETAFNKAQAGADIAIGNAGGITNDELASYGLFSNVTVSTIENANPDGTVTFSNIAVGAVATVNLENKDGNVQILNNVTVGWKPLPNNSSCNGILVEILRFDGLNYVVDRSSYKNNGDCVVDGTPTSIPSADLEGYYNSGNITINNGSKMRIRPFGSSADIKVSGISSAPQSTTYKVTGTNDAGEARAIEVNKGASSLPGIFDYVLFSKADLVKNN